MTDNLTSKQQAWASFQIGLGIMCVLMGVSDFLQKRELLLDAFVILVGINEIIYGFLANRNQKIANHQTLSIVVSVLAIISSALIIFRFFFKS